MKRTMWIGILCGAAAAGCSGVEPESLEPQEFGQSEQAATGTYDLAQYMVPNCNAAQAYTTNATGMRRFVPMGVDGSGRGRFVYVTSGDGANFLEFTVDGSWIRFWSDTSWAHNNHPPAPECGGSDYCDEVSGPVGVATTTCRCLWYHGAGSADYVYNAPRDASNTALGERWLPRTISLTGETEQQVPNMGSFYIQARRKSNCSATTSWHSSSAQQTTTVGVTHFASYNGYSDVIRMRKLAGPGAGEVFFYAKNLGWIGFEVPAAGYADWIQSPTGATPMPNLSCFAFTQGSICSVMGGGGGTCTATVAADRWKGQYWNNLTFSGNPVMTRDDGAGNLNFNWGTGSPGAACGVPADNFTARWTRTVNFSAGTWRFTTTTDDGVRLYVDGALKLDKWIDQGPTPYSVDVALAAGNHTLRMDYYERGGGAVAALSWVSLGNNPYPSCPCPGGSFDNYCLHAPSTSGCPMTFSGGYCDPNANGTFDDADWVRGYYEFQDYCR